MLECKCVNLDQDTKPLGVILGKLSDGMIVRSETRKSASNLLFKLLLNNNAAIRIECRNNFSCGAMLLGPQRERDMYHVLG